MKNSSVHLLLLSEAQYTCCCSLKYSTAAAAALWSTVQLLRLLSEAQYSCCCCRKHSWVQLQLLLTVCKLGHGQQCICLSCYYYYNYHNSLLLLTWFSWHKDAIFDEKMLWHSHNLKINKVKSQTSTAVHPSLWTVVLNNKLTTLTVFPVSY